LSGAEDDFEIVSLVEEEVKGKQVHHLRLTARRGTESMYRQIDLWVDRELWLPVRQELVELNNTVNRIDLEDIVINQDIEDSVFKLDLPSDVERVKG
ncbi:MAG: outer membrane lipoprotein-sorting protein, partial [Vicinamibacteria bacterium]